MRLVDVRVSNLVGDAGAELEPAPPLSGPGQILLFDNGKLDPRYGEYHALFDELTTRLPAAMSGVTTTEYGLDLLDVGAHGVPKVCDYIVGLGVSGVVLALCDWGVSQTTVLLAAQLETRGLPTATIALGAGELLARSTARTVRPGLLIEAIQSPRWSDRDRIVQEASTVLDSVVARFTAGAVREAPAVERKAPPDGSGWLTLPDGDEDVTRSFTELLQADGLGDGFPLYPPTEQRVRALLNAAGLAGDEVIWPAIHPRADPVRATEVAGLAVMAGCPPRVAPVVFAAFRAMADPAYRLEQGAITTHPGGTLVLVSGPATERYGIASGRGSLGPNNFANAVVGRAVALAYSFLLDARPGISDLTVQGSPAEYSYCCGEAVDASPWSSLGVDAGFLPGETTVTVHKCEGPHSVLDSQSTDPEQLLRTFASVMATLGGNNAYVRGSQTVVFLNPEHARLLADAGLTKLAVRERLFELARNDAADLVGRGLVPIVGLDATAGDRVPIAERAEDILIVVTGGAGPNSQVAIPWGHARAVTALVEDSLGNSYHP